MSEALLDADEGSSLSVLDYRPGEAETPTLSQPAPTIVERVVRERRRGVEKRYMEMVERGYAFDHSDYHAIERLADLDEGFREVADPFHQSLLDD